MKGLAMTQTMNRYLILLTMLFVVAASYGCAQMAERFGLAKPTTFAEQVAYVEATAQGTIVTVQGLTCRRYTAAGTCTEPGRPIHPARGKEYVNKLGDARVAAKAASAMPSVGGTCLGEKSTPVACLALANSLLMQVQKVLEDLAPPQ